jgi:mono/diheme cytochrome c family protein
MKVLMSGRWVSMAGASALDLCVLVAAAGLLAWGGLYIGAYSGRFDANEFSEIARGPAAKVVAASADPNAKTLAVGAAIYTQCAACHLADGSGDPGKNIPPLAGSEWVQAPGPGRIIRVVLLGLGGKITVKGQDYSGNQMNPWMKTAENPGGLSAEDIAAVLSYVRNSWGNKAGMVTPDQVKLVADAVSKETHPAGWTQSPDDLMKMPEMVGGGAASPSIDDLKNALKALSPDKRAALLKEVGP